jgi:hypothetical protein
MRGARVARRSAIAAIPALCCALTSGCSTPFALSHMAFVTRTPGLVEPVILAREVQGEYCFTEDVVTVSTRPPWRARLADPGRAIDDALAQVPGANVLTHIEVKTRVEQYLLFQRICSIVVGNAGRVE